jgi:hypothetical protein
MGNAEMPSSTSHVLVENAGRFGCDLAVQRYAPGARLDGSAP